MHRMNETKKGRQTLIKNDFKFALKQYIDWGLYINNIYYENDKPIIYLCQDVEYCDLFSEAVANKWLKELNKHEKKYKIVKMA